MSVQQDINLPNPDPTIINLYTHTMRDKVTNKQNDHIFHFKTSKMTLPSRRKISDQIVIITSDSGATYHILLYDLLFSWIASHRFKQTLPSDSEGRLLLTVQNVSDSALERFLRLSLIRVFYRPAPSRFEPLQKLDKDDFVQHDTDLKSLLTLADTFEVGINIRRRIMHDIYNWLLMLTQVCSSKGWNPLKSARWIGWIVFGIEEKPIVLWLIEMAIIENVTHAGRGQSCLIQADWYGEYKRDEPLTTPYNTKITRGKGLVQNLCYLNILLQQMLTQFSTFNLPESMYNTVRQVYGVLRSPKVKFNGKSISQQCEEIFVKATQPLPGTHKVSPASSSSSTQTTDSSSLPPLSAASAAARPSLVGQSSPQASQPRLSHMEEMKSWFYDDPQTALVTLMDPNKQQSLKDSLGTLAEEEVMLERLQIAAKSSKDAQTAVALQTNVVKSMKKVVELTENTERVIKLVNEQFKQDPKPSNFDSNVELMILSMQKLDEQSNSYTKLAEHVNKEIPWSKIPIVARRSSPQRLTGAQRRAASKAASQQ